MFCPFSHILSKYMSGSSSSSHSSAFSSLQQLDSALVGLLFPPQNGILSVVIPAATSFCTCCPLIRSPFQMVIWLFLVVGQLGSGAMSHYNQVLPDGLMSGGAGSIVSS